jgi:hypothetical protein
MSGRHYFISAAFMICALCAAAQAEQITFTTSGQFTNGTNTITSSDGGATVTYTPGPPTSLTTVGSNSNHVINLGTFTVSGTGTFASTGFTLTINQSSPTAETIVFTGTLSGTVGSNLQIIFSYGQEGAGPVDVTGQRLIYALSGTTSNNRPIYRLSPGANEVFGRVQQVPEPATMLLLATGLAGVAASRVRKRRKV